MTVLENVLTGLHARTAAGLGGVLLRLPAFRARGAARGRAGAGGARVGRAGGQGGACGRAALSYGDQRRLEIARAMAPGAAPADARRAGGRHEPGGDGGAGRPDPRARAAGDDRAAGRARHGFRDGHLRQRQRAEFRPADLRRAAGAGAAGSRRDRGLSRATRSPRGWRPGRKVGRARRLDERSRDRGPRRPLRADRGGARRQPGGAGGAGGDADRRERGRQDDDHARGLGPGAARGPARCGSAGGRSRAGRRTGSRPPGCCRCRRGGSVSPS